MEFDWSSYFITVIRTIPLLFIVSILVTLWGRFGISGKVQLLSSFITGLILGVIVMFLQIKPPVDNLWGTYVYWFSNIIYGLSLGGIASLYYDSNKYSSQKAIKTLEKEAVMGKNN